MTNNLENTDREHGLMVEQYEILGEIQYIYQEYKGRGKRWNRFRGNTLSNIIVTHLQRHLPSDVKVLKLAYAEGCPTEFDIMVVNKDAEPLELTDAYRIDDVRLVVELKAAGVFHKREEIKQKMSDMREKCKAEVGKPMLYLSTWEAKAHVNEVRDAFGNENSFMLRVDGESEFVYREWERFLDRIMEILNSNC
jgi:hypothetical protein